MRSTEVQALLNEARAISDELGSATTTTEKTALLERADELENRVTDQRRSRDREADRKALTKQLDALGTAGFTAGSVQTSAFAALKSASWELGRAAAVPAEVVLGLESKALIADGGDANPLRLGGIVPEGTDGRRLYPALPTLNLQDRTRVDALVSTGRSLANAQAMQLAIDGVGEKPVTSSGATLQTFDATMVASVSAAYPVAIVGLPAFQDLVNVDLAVAYQDSLDDLVVTTLIDQAGATDDTGADLFEQLRKAVTAIQGEGFNPTVAAISPEDAETLDLTRGTATDQFILDPAPRSAAFSPLWSLTLRIVKGLTDPIVLDPSCVNLHLGPVRFDSDPYTGFSTNEVKFRYEGPAVVVVRQPAGVFVVGTASS